MDVSGKGHRRTDGLRLKLLTAGSAGGKYLSEFRHFSLWRSCSFQVFRTARVKILSPLPSGEVGRGSGRERATMISVNDFTF